MHLNPNARWVYAWLLLLPAAVLMWPSPMFIVGGFSRASFQTPAAGRPAVCRPDKQRAERSVFGRSLGNHFLFMHWAPYRFSVCLALIMAVWVNGRWPGSGVVRPAYFTPTILPMIAVATSGSFFYTPQIGLLDKIPRLLICPA